MKPLQYYKKQIFIMGCLGMFPMLVFAQETLSSANGLHGDYSGSRVERSADGDKLDIEFSIGLVEKLKSQQMMYISPRFVSVDGKKSVELQCSHLQSEALGKPIQTDVPIAAHAIA